MDAQQHRGARCPDPGGKAAEADWDKAQGVSAGGARQYARHGGGSNGAGADDDAPATAGEAVKGALGALGEAKEYLGYFVSAKLDGIKLSLRNVGIYAALGLVGLAAGIALLATTIVLLLTGLAGAIGAIWDPDIPWAGALIVGGVILLAVALAVVFGM